MRRYGIIGGTDEQRWVTFHLARRGKEDRPVCSKESDAVERVPTGQMRRRVVGTSSTSSVNEVLDLVP